MKVSLLIVSNSTDQNKLFFTYHTHFGVELEYFIKLCLCETVLMNRCRRGSAGTLLEHDD